MNPHSPVLEEEDEVCAERIKFVGLFGPSSFSDPSGLIVPSGAGWGSVSAEERHCDTKEGLVIHFDGRKSPGE